MSFDRHNRQSTHQKVHSSRNHGDSGATLGDILSHALAEAKIQSKVTVGSSQDTMTLAPRHFSTKRVITIDHGEKIERIKTYRREHECTLLVAKHRVEIMMLIEMLFQAEGMSDINLIKEWAQVNLYDSLTRTF